MYVEASEPALPGDVYSLESGVFPSLAKTATVSFWYSMSGAGMGSLSVLTKNSSGSLSTLWTVSGDQGAGWLQQSVDLPTGSTGLIFQGTVGADWRSDIAIDDVKVTASAVAIPNTPGPTTTISRAPTTASTTTTTTTTVTILSTTTTTSTTTMTSTSSTTTLVYSIEALQGEVTGDFVKGAGYVDLPNGCGTNCQGYIKFRLVCSVSVGSLRFRVEVNTPNGQDDSYYIQIDNGADSTWHLGQQKSWGWSTYSGGKAVQAGEHTVQLNPREDGPKVKTLQVEGTQCLLGPISSTPQVTPSPLQQGLPDIACDFEGGFCNWINSGSPGHEWSLQSGSTQSSGTGPSGAYGGSYYAYTEASYGGNDQDFFLEQSFAPVQASFSLSFYYHMYGSNMGSLTLEAQSGTAAWQQLWTLAGDQGDEWKVVSLLVPSGTTALRFYGRTGNSYRSDICIDDLTVTP